MKKLLLLYFIALGQVLLGQTPGNGVTDINGNNYPTVIIGSQEWMSENLRTSSYDNGDPIPNISDSSQWIGLSTGAWVYFNNDSTFDTSYGKLYNWYAIDHIRKLCPTGWRVPSDEDFDTLVSFLGGQSVAGGKLKEVGTAHWNAPNTGAGNSSGFTALPGGSREDGSFDDIGDYGYFWSIWSSHPTTRHRWELRHTQALFARFNVSREDAYSCRCIKLSTLGIGATNPSEINVYPNPTTGKIRIETEGVEKVEIMNIEGRQIFTGKETEIDLSSQPKGIYIIKVTTSKGVAVEKVVLE